jgi:hypothetical protein
MWVFWKLVMKEESKSLDATNALIYTSFILRHFILGFRDFFHHMFISTTQYGFSSMPKIIKIPKSWK